MDILKSVVSDEPLTEEQTARIQAIDWNRLLEVQPNTYYELACLMIKDSPILDERLQFVEGVVTKRLSLVRDHPSLTVAKEVFRQRQLIMTTSVEGETTDLFPCPRCKARESTYMGNVAVRSGDEPLATQFRCTKCDNIWFQR
jgi:DNA-directed RNA polymerase subunit M/transcription elongation factor TFIIS